MSSPLILLLTIDWVPGGDVRGPWPLRLPSSLYLPFPFIPLSLPLALSLSPFPPPALPLSPLPLSRPPSAFTFLGPLALVRLRKASSAQSPTTPQLKGDPQGKPCWQSFFSIAKCFAYHASLWCPRAAVGASAPALYTLRPGHHKQSPSLPRLSSKHFFASKKLFIGEYKLRHF